VLPVSRVFFERFSSLAQCTLNRTEIGHLLTISSKVTQGTLAGALRMPPVRSDWPLLRSERLRVHRRPEGVSEALRGTVYNS